MIFLAPCGAGIKCKEDVQSNQNINGGKEIKDRTKCVSLGCCFIGNDCWVPRGKIIFL